MSPKDKKKKQEDTDYTDEMGGGLAEESPPLTREGFYRILYRVIRPLKSKGTEDKDKGDS